MKSFILFLLTIFVFIVTSSQSSYSPSWKNYYNNFLLELPGNNNFRCYLYHNEYITCPNVIKQSHYKYERISLILHISSDRNFHEVENHLKNYDGPISLGIYMKSSFSNKEKTIEIYKLLKAYAKKYSKLSVHFIFKISRKKNYYNYLTLSEYPINVIRNIARKHSATRYIVIADIDHMFSKNFETKMLKVAKVYLKENYNNVLVYRIFEVESKNLKSGPKNKGELKKLMSNNKASVFHPYNKKGHYIPYLKQWFKKNDTTNPGIQFEATYNRAQWEPQFVSLRNIPFHDENFQYLLRDNMHLRWELCRANYSFLVVNDVFMYHLGRKKNGEKNLIDKIRYHLNGKNKNIMKKFEIRMQKLYPITKNKCPNIWI
ncbi:N-acetyllactosaminide beta-1,3-N-acetylglucosaminyltransferase [Strongyloides ratti]|uniref:N-acetyllactosaminide beta-1,3-N-acetylglucosaminyltransferase n=1 Tax=Strongyloides ratti TaxID=34506 RepID=A0A090LPC3_STRRB|nr:N-acetyllactosaminide beta-1,3-N-acetylglucosaminyltransferase [Strongyloides ratti]CEF69375.1 N-acetyllactosaminide beta-1,3-N-acetylglucosaminyltransferase [Strongyloides ratti]